MFSDNKLDSSVTRVAFRNSTTISSYQAGHAYGDNLCFWKPDLTIDELIDYSYCLRVSRRYDVLSYRIGFVIGYLSAAKQVLTPLTLNMFLKVSDSTGKVDSMIHFRSQFTVTISGVVARDPELNVTADGTPVTKFSIPVERYKGKDAGGERKTATTWYNITCWRQDAEMVEKYLQKGAAVTIIGDYEPRPYTDREGVVRISHDVTARDICQILGAPKTESTYNDVSDNSDPFLPVFPDDEPAPATQTPQRQQTGRQPATSRSK